MYDYKKPLYKSAMLAMDDMDLSSYRRIAEYFRLLGDYERSAEYMETCLDFPRTYMQRLIIRAEYAETRKEIENADAAMNALRRDVGKEVFSGKEWQDSYQKFLKALRKADRRLFLKEYRKPLALGGLFTAILIFGLVTAIWESTLPGRLMRKGARAAEQGDYISAASYYKEARLKNSEREREKRIEGKWTEACYKAGEQCMAEENYDLALEYFEDAGAEEEAEAASLAYAGRLSEDGNLSEAVGYLEKAGDTKEADDARVALASRLTDQEEYSDAIDTLRQIADSEAMEKELDELYMSRAEKQIGAFIDYLKDPSEEPEISAVEKAAKLGSIIDDVDGQLLFTSFIAGSGFSPYEVYPAGVIIKNLPIDYDFSKASDNAAPDLSKMMVVFQFQTLKNTTPGQMRHWGINDYSYFDHDGPEGEENVKVKIFPGLMYSIDSRFRARYLSECTAYLLIRSWYEPTDPIRGVWHSRNRTTLKVTDNEGNYDTFTRHDEIYLCDRKQKDVLKLLAKTTNYAEAYKKSLDLDDDTVPVFEYTDEDLLTTADSLIGQGSDIWFDKKLKKAIKLINAQEE